MREAVRDKGRIEHIVQAIDNVAKFIEGVTFEEFCKDQMMFFAVVKNIEIIGEAANKLTKELRNQHPEVEWDVIIGMRHVLVHDYYNIKPALAWFTATTNLPEVRPLMLSILKELQ